MPILNHQGVSLPNIPHLHNSNSANHLTRAFVVSNTIHIYHYKCNLPTPKKSHLLYTLLSTLLSSFLSCSKTKCFYLSLPHRLRTAEDIYHKFPFIWWIIVILKALSTHVILVYNRI